MNHGGEGIGQLPVEVLERVFGVLSPNTLYDKFIEPYQWGQWNDIQLLAYKCIFSHKFIVRNYRKTRGFDHSRIYYSSAEMSSAFVVQGFERAYQIMRQMMSYNLESVDPVFPSEIGLLLRFTEVPDLESQILSFLKVTELLSFDNYHEGAIPRICFQLVYDLTITPDLMEYIRKIVQRIEALGGKTHKLLCVNRFKSQSQTNNIHLFHPAMSRNLHELYLWNNPITDYSLKRYLRTSPPVLRVLDLTANTITSLENLTLPISLERFLIGANNLQSLKGPNYHECVNLHTLDASINTITDVQNLRLPPSLKYLKVAYNEVTKLCLEDIPPYLNVLEFARNLIRGFDESFVLPATIKELHLSANGLVSLPRDFFAFSSGLRILDLSENKIDDLDELGCLPNSLQELMLDNNEIDYSNYTNILTENLTKLSMNSTGLVEMSSLEFPSKLQVLNLATNEISIFKDLKFRGGLKRLDLSENKLNSFNLDKDNVSIPDSLEYLDLSHNPFPGLETISFPPKLTHLFLKDIPLGILDNSAISKFPDTVTELKLDHTNWSRDASVAVKPVILSLDFKTILPRLCKLSMNNNSIVSIKDTTYPAGLTYLSYEHNMIGTIELDNVPTGIKQIRLNENLFHYVEIKGSTMIYSVECETGKGIEVTKLPYFPYIDYFGLCGDQTELMRSGFMYQ